MAVNEEKTKKCAHCGQVKPVTEFYKDSHTRDGLQSWCKQCSNARGKKSVERAEKELLAAAQEHLERTSEEAPARQPLTPQQIFLATIDWEKRTFATAARIFAQICAVANPTESTSKLCIDYASQFVSDYREQLTKGTDNGESEV